jgi:hypothetical protein
MINLFEQSDKIGFTKVVRTKLVWIALWHQSSDIDKKATVSLAITKID